MGVHRVLKTLQVHETPPGVSEIPEVIFYFDCFFIIMAYYFLHLHAYVLLMFICLY